jgi:hypothetical protein
VLHGSHCVWVSEVGTLRVPSCKFLSSRPTQEKVYSTHCAMLTDICAADGSLPDFEAHPTRSECSADLYGGCLMKNYRWFLGRTHDTRAVSSQRKRRLIFREPSPQCGRVEHGHRSCQPRTR